MDNVSSGSSHSSSSVKRDSISSVGNSDCTLQSFGLGAIPNGCQASSRWKDKLVDLIKEYECIFFRDHLDYGEAREDLTVR